MSLTSSIALSGMLWLVEPATAPAAPSTGPATVPATVPATSPTDAAWIEVERLLLKLAGPDGAERDAAQIALLDLGEAGLAALDAARREVRDPDVQVRLDTLLVQIRERADIGASKVSLKFEDAPLDEVLASLGKQVRADFGGDLVNEVGNGRADGLPKVTVNLEQVSFWRAMQDIQESANVVFFPQPDGWRVTRNFGQGGSVRGSESGAFIVQPMSASYTRNISYARNMGADGENFSISFQALGEPKIKLGGGNGTMTLDKAVDSNGNDLLGAQRTNQISNNGMNGIMCGVQLKYPKNPGTTIAEVSGLLRISIARRTQQIVSDDLMGGGKINATIDAAKIRIEPVTDEPSRPAVSFNITIDSGGDPALAQRMQQSVQQMVRVIDARDVGLRLSNFNVTRSDQRGVTMRLQYTSQQPQLSKGPYKLRIEVPTSFREVDVPFMLKDLRMP